MRSLLRGILRVLGGSIATQPPSSETQGQLVGPGGKKSGKEMKRRMFTRRKKAFFRLVNMRSLRKQPSFFAPGPSGVSRNATRAGSEEGRRQELHASLHIEHLPYKGKTL